MIAIIFAPAREVWGQSCVTLIVSCSRVVLLEPIVLIHVITRHPLIATTTVPVIIKMGRALAISDTPGLLARSTTRVWVSIADLMGAVMTGCALAISDTPGLRARSTTRVWVSIADLMGAVMTGRALVRGGGLEISVNIGGGGICLAAPHLPPAPALINHLHLLV